MSADQRLNEYFWLSEFTDSREASVRGIDNRPDRQQLDAIVNVLAPGMWRLRQLLGTPVSISSGYRCARLNRVVRGSSDSLHMRGLAADFASAPWGTPLEVCRFLAKHVDELMFDELIYEGTWVHVGFAPVGKVAAGEVMTAHFHPGKRTTYTFGLA